MARFLLALVLILSIAWPARADGPVGVTHLPIITKGCSMATMATLEISDGTLEGTITLLRGNIHVEDWKPNVAQIKSGGIWQDSPLSTGRRMVDRRFGNVTDTLSLIVSSPGQDETIRQVGNLLRLLEKARDYTTSGWQTDPVWIKRQAGCETNPTYALLFDYKLPNLANPYAQPFAAATQLATMDKFTLSLEHSIWLSNPPGAGTCVETSSAQVLDISQTGATWVSATAAPAAGAYDFVQTSTGRIIGGDINNTWHSDDDGDTWNNVAVGGTVYSMLLLSSGRIIAGGNATVYLSDDDGATWNPAGLGAGGVVFSLIELTRGPTIGRVLAGTDGSRIFYSDDQGATWAVLTADPDAFIYALLQTSTGRILASDYAQIWKSDDNGATWQIARTVAGYVTSFVQLASGRILAGGDATIWVSDNDGTNWAVANAAVSSYSFSLMQMASGRILSGEAGQVRRSDDEGVTWEVETGVPTGNVWALFQTTTGRLLADDSDGTYWKYGPLAGPSIATVGADADCADGIFVANKQNTANLTNIYIDDGGAWTANLFPFTFPGAAVPLLPAIPTVGDAVYFGNASGKPFESLVFDLNPVLSFTNAYTIVWEYYDGAAWSTLPAQDGTNSGAGAFRTLGVSSVHWTPPTDWDPTHSLAGDGGPAVTGLWVRARVTGVAGLITAPSQQNRNVYTVVLPYAEITAAQVPGDIPALAQIKLNNRSDKDGSNTPKLWDNRLIVGLRSYDRGPTFSAFLNASDEQNPVGVTVTDGANTAIGASVTGITGRVATYTGPGAAAWTDEIIFTLGSTIARDYYGTYHAFLRAKLDAGGSSGDVHARLQVRTGSGGVTLTSAEDYLKTTNDFEVLDFGRISIPASGILSFDDLGDSTQLVVQLHDIAPGGLKNLIHDLILIPVDEVALDAVDYANIAASVVGGQSSARRLLDFDSLTFQKVDVRTLVRSADSNAFVSAIYVPSGGPAFLQCNARQRLWVFAERTDDVGDDPVWLAPPWIAHSVQVWRNSRWLGFRGDR